MKIDGFQKLTLLDYPGKVACMIFTVGCNFHCPFCQNASLISVRNKGCHYQEEEILSYLEKRKNILDGIVISGGEPLLQKDIKKFIRKVKDMGYLIKLDTNGSQPNLLRELIEDSLIDYVAMDIKNEFPKYFVTAGKFTFLDKVKESIAILKENKVEYEFRTTIIKEFHTLHDIENICMMIGTSSKYYLQNFVDSDDVPRKNLHGFTREELQSMNTVLQRRFPNMEIRSL